jgi:hypothetical protein
MNPELIVQLAVIAANLAFQLRGQAFEAILTDPSLTPEKRKELFARIEAAQASVTKLP